MKPDSKLSISFCFTYLLLFLSYIIIFSASWNSQTPLPVFPSYLSQSLTLHPSQSLGCSTPSQEELRPEPAPAPRRVFASDDSRHAFLSLLGCTLTSHPQSSLGLIPPPPNSSNTSLSSFLLGWFPPSCLETLHPLQQKEEKKMFSAHAIFPFVGCLANLQKIMGPCVLSAFCLLMSPSTSSDIPSIDWDQIHCLPKSDSSF